MNIFSNKKILIYGLGKSGMSAFKFLENKSEVFLYDDKKVNIKIQNLEKKFISLKKIFDSKFDRIILSPGIDINKCKLSKFLKKNYDKTYTDLDVFYSYFKNNSITITGTNGKSTTSQLLYEILSNHKIDARLVGNIGNPILSAKNIKTKTIFIIEASSYQLEYSKIFKSKYAMILNISPDHIERHKTINKYVKAKFKLLNNQTKGNLAFVKKDDVLISKELRKNKFSCQITKVDTKRIDNFLKKINNDYFLSETNKENLSFILEISKKLNLKNKFIIKTIQNFKGLKFRQQIVFKKKNLTVINDSKSTSFSSSVGALKINPNIYWLLGGIPKKGDKFNLSKKYFKNVKAYIYGKNSKFFSVKLKGKIKCKKFNNLKKAFKNILGTIKKDKSDSKTILFSPSAASFDTFKNFEERGFYFNKLIKEHVNEI